MNIANIISFFNLPEHSFYALCSIILILIVSTFLVTLIKYFQPHKDHQSLILRLRSWWYMILILCAVIYLGQTASIIFFACLSFLALKEFLSIVPIRLVDRRAIFWAYLSIPLQYYWITIHWYGMFIIFIPVYIFLLLPARMVLTGETKGFIKSSSILHWATMLTVFCISHLAYLLVLDNKNTAAGNIGLVLFILFITQFNDVCQYVFGKLLGKHKIIPKVSPNKTWEGFIGGVVTITICSGYLAPYLTPLSQSMGFMLGLLISIIGFIGDVVISSVKRDLQIKDTGYLIPGHGGILDRIDSLMYTAPIFFHVLYYVSY